MMGRGGKRWEFRDFRGARAKRNFGFWQISCLWGFASRRSSFFELEMVKKTRNQAIVVDAAALVLRWGARARQGSGEADGGETSEPSIEWKERQRDEKRDKKVEKTPSDTSDGVKRAVKNSLKLNEIEQNQTHKMSIWEKPCEFAQILGFSDAYLT